MKPGIYPWMPNQKYHDGPGVSNSDLTTLGTRSPAHYKYKKENPTEPTDAMNVGQAFHTLTLEPHKFTDRFHIFQGEKRSKEKKEEWAAAEGSGKTVIREAKLEDVSGMVKAIRAHDDAAALLDKMDSQYEKSLYWLDRRSGALCKVRPDIMPDPNIIPALVDLKSCQPGANRETVSWSRQVGKFRYHVQAAYYLEGARKATGIDYKTFIWITVESEAPYGINVFQASREMLAEGQAVYRRDLDLYADCLRQNLWPSYEEGVKTVNLMPWDKSGLLYNENSE